MKAEKVEILNKKINKIRGMLSEILTEDIENPFENETHELWEQIADVMYALALGDALEAIVVMQTALNTTEEDIMEVSKETGDSLPKMLSKSIGELVRRTFK